MARSLIGTDSAQVPVDGAAQTPPVAEVSSRERQRQQYEALVQQLQYEFEKSVAAFEQQIDALEQHNALLSRRNQQLERCVDSLQQQLSQSHEKQRELHEAKEQHSRHQHAAFQHEMRQKQTQLDRLLQLVQQLQSENQQLVDVKQQLQTLQQENECLKELLVHSAALQQPEEEEDAAAHEQGEEFDHRKRQCGAALELDLVVPPAREREQRLEPQQQQQQPLLLQHQSKTNQSTHPQLPQHHGRERLYGYQHGPVEELESYAPTSPTSSMERSPPSTPLLGPKTSGTLRSFPPKRPASGATAAAATTTTTATATTGISRRSSFGMDAPMPGKDRPTSRLSLPSHPELIRRSRHSPGSVSSSVSSASSGSRRHSLTSGRRLNQEIQSLRAKVDACFLPMEQSTSKFNE